MNPKYLARIRPPDNAEQIVKDHCRSTASYVKGIDHSYYYEGYTTFKAEEL